MKKILLFLSLNILGFLGTSYAMTTQSSDNHNNENTMIPPPPPGNGNCKYVGGPYKVVFRGKVLWLYKYECKKESFNNGNTGNIGDAQNNLGKGGNEINVAIPVPPSGNGPCKFVGPVKEVKIGNKIFYLYKYECKSIIKLPKEDKPVLGQNNKSDSKKALDAFQDAVTNGYKKNDIKDDKPPLLFPPTSPTERKTQSGEIKNIKELRGIEKTDIRRGMIIPKSKLPGADEKKPGKETPTNKADLKELAEQLVNLTVKVNKLKELLNNLDNSTFPKKK